MTPQTVARPTFEELRVGDRLPGLVRGPMSAAHLMRWSAATENWHRIHYDHPYATQVEQLPGLLVSGNFKQQLLTELVAGWLRPDGWPVSVSFEFRKMNVQDDTLTAWGEVTALRTWERYGIVVCDIGIVDGAGNESTPGRAVGIVPLAGGPAVPHPFDLGVPR
ncbi:hypothetical protein KZZ52_36810 [Dactylosporangium sp. AC04546]|uniref:MaoC family dehydratase n=1 Tax=Dactylosporangium sp. AC04546 TaxID=2862460 RepID=UPI001EDDE4E9|nr:hypothetical protein [Dactylosporangium sp. AC04546]WVK79527.1 hypothetical protein KZZ52_36810 [Dactylosporangium sp. AC04546]